VKYYLRGVVLGLALLASAWCGAAFQNHKAVASAAAGGGEPITIIGLGACGKWMGGIIVTRDGKPHPSNEITEEMATKLAKSLPEGNNTMAMAPCVLGGGKDT
jgi:hypothetical protein